MNRQQFIEIVTKKLMGKLSPEEEGEFYSFLDDNEFYAQQYELFEKYWNENQYSSSDASHLFQKVLSRIGEMTDEDHSEMHPTKKGFRWLTAWSKIAAILILGVFMFRYFYVYHSPEGSLSWHTIATAKGVKKKVTLIDGTEIIINADSRLTYPEHFGKENREVYLSGEAFFDIKKDTQHPFIVHSKKMNIKVLGTAFNVKAFDEDDHSETTLLRGAIEVTLEDRPKDIVMLRPSEKLIVEYADHNDYQKRGKNVRDKDMNTLTQITTLQKSENIILETSWLESKLIFKDEKFDDLAKRLERWYNVNISLENEELRDMSFTGTFKNETIEDVLHTLKLIESFHFSKEGKEITIYKPIAK